MAHTIIGVMGPSRCDAATAQKAERFGRLLAEAGFTLLCGGGTGVMEAVSRGAHAAGGLVIGVLPGHDATESAPNPYVDLPIFTGISHARNLINVLSSRVVVAIAGAHGTLSEIAFAIKCGKPVVLLDSWQFSVPGSPPAERVYRAKDPQEALALVKQLA